MPEELVCPIITDYTRQIKIDDGLLTTLFALRRWNTEGEEKIPFARPPHLREFIFPGNDPLRLREYQKQQIHHMCRLPRFINGDAVGLGKTIDTIAAAAWMKSKFPQTKVIIFATKSTTWQWHDEVERFSTLRPYVMQDVYKGITGYNGRYAQLIDFLEQDKQDILICKYSSLIGTRRVVTKVDASGCEQKVREAVSQEIKLFAKIFKEHRQNIVLVLDECQKFKTPGTSTRSLVRHLASYSGKVWALSATVIKNGLEEFYQIAHAIGIKPLGELGDFNENHCVFTRQYIGNGRFQPMLKGYKNVAEFKRQMRPFFLGRSQAQVKEPMPRLSTIFHPIDLDEKQARLLLDEIPNGTFQLPPAIIREAGQIFEKERDPNNQMTMLSIQQLVANHWALIDRNNEKDFHTKTLSPKEDALLDMLDGDMRGEKVIVFTKFRTWIDRLQWLTENKHFTERKFLRITGAESEAQRNENKKRFQEPGSGYDMIVINSAGIEGINLQQAAHLICLDLPWSWGDLIQLVGRMVRMASPHSACTLHVLAAKGTIDEYTVETLKGKKGVFEKILGASHSAGILDESTLVDLESGMEQGGSDTEFRSLMTAFVKSSSLSKFLEGDYIAAARQPEYKMTFEKKKSRKEISLEDSDQKWQL